MNSTHRALSLLLLGALFALLVPSGAGAASKRSDTPEEKQQRKERIRKMYKLRFDDAPAANPATGSAEHRLAGAFPDTTPPGVKVPKSSSTTKSRSRKRRHATTHRRAHSRAVAGDDRSILGQEGKSIYFGQIYGKNAGGVVACNIELATGTPNPTRGITYGLGVSCNNPGIRGTGIAHLGDFTPPTTIRSVQSGSFFNVQGDYNAPVNFRSPAQYYSRESETQMENIYAYFDLTIDGVDGVDGWYTQPTVGGAVDSIRCTPALKRTLTCELITAPMPFLPTAAGCTSGDVCGTPGALTSLVGPALAKITGIASALPGQVGGIVSEAQASAKAVLAGETSDPGTPAESAEYDADPSRGPVTTQAGDIVEDEPAGFVAYTNNPQTRERLANGTLTLNQARQQGRVNSFCLISFRHRYRMITIPGSTPQAFSVRYFYNWGSRVSCKPYGIDMAIQSRLYYADGGFLESEAGRNPPSGRTPDAATIYSGATTNYSTRRRFRVGTVINLKADRNEIAGVFRATTEGQSACTYDSNFFEVRCTAYSRVFR